MDYGPEHSAEVPDVSYSSTRRLKEIQEAEEENMVTDVQGESLFINILTFLFFSFISFLGKVAKETSKDQTVDPRPAAIRITLNATNSTLWHNG